MNMNKEKILGLLKNEEENAKLYLRHNNHVSLGNTLNFFKEHFNSEHPEVDKRARELHAKYISDYLKIKEEHGSETELERRNTRNAATRRTTERLNNYLKSRKELHKV